MFIETDVQASAKLRQERHVHGSMPGGRDLLGLRSIPLLPELGSPARKGIIEGSGHLTAEAALTR